MTTILKVAPFYSPFKRQEKAWGTETQRVCSCGMKRSFLKVRFFSGNEHKESQYIKVCLAHPFDYLQSNCFFYKWMKHHHWTNHFIMLSLLRKTVCKKHCRSCFTMVVWTILSNRLKLKIHLFSYICLLPVIERVYGLIQCFTFKNWISQRKINLSQLFSVLRNSAVTVILYNVFTDVWWIVKAKVRR